jgi:hypothetical protein
MSRNLYLLWNEASVILWAAVALLAWRVPRLAGRMWLALAFLLLAAGALWRVLAAGHRLPEDAPPEMGHWLHLAALVTFLMAGIRAAFPGGETAGQGAPETGTSLHGNPLLAGLPLVLGVAALAVVGLLAQVKYHSAKSFQETERSLDYRWDRERESPMTELPPEEPVDSVTGPDNQEYRQALQTGEAAQAEALLQRGDYEEAQKVAADLPQAVEDEALGYFLAARVLARCADLAVKDGQPTQARDDADGALRRLREAVEHGFRDVDRLRTDPAFEALRQGDDFRDLVSDLEAKRREEP